MDTKSMETLLVKYWRELHGQQAELLFYTAQKLAERAQEQRDAERKAKFPGLRLVSGKP